MKAKKKPLEEKTAEDYGVCVEARLRVLASEEPVVRKSGVEVDRVDDLLDRLKSEVRVL